MLSINLKIALIALLMQKSCCPVDFELAKNLLIKSGQLFSTQKETCVVGAALFINPMKKVSC